ncbi:cutinase transcription factor 1 beta [Colletotrichum scovillei]|uniref:Cutinase transcription factor 1 beta n=1 Tax=Colletotrichum scovillei TaxID=1209932 RepID=A0A9P7RIA8_9PEZI|nr:cutinase transcription factor 1 beta [Colletotrichum scovillei]KAF4773737.1 cutinase transcription factor 1 beta [Colletotrichum scovillei]KAG7056044.1 cutinase transcription factor 1 beta [Colletotrichum scovillei]KAG7075491.1 cutinase transcription factor 1 beta [Colletotrichum scovillei]KAG7082642.1 cutinase transcription factor 1 beta [Colletotrichum scovillei]
MKAKGQKAVSPDDNDNVSHSTPLTPAKAASKVHNMSLQHNDSPVVAATTGSSPPSAAAVRTFKRAAVACKACNLRKVRCTVTLSGPPCANCSVDGITCEVLSRKRRRNSDQLPMNPTPGGGGENTLIIIPQRAQPRRRLVEPQTPGPSSGTLENEEAVESRDDRFTSAPPEDHRRTTPQVNGGPRSSTSPRAAETRSVGGGPSAPTTRPYDAVRALLPAKGHRPPDLSDATEDSSAYAETLEGGKNREDGCVPFYPGDQRGPAFLIDICEPNRSSKDNHFLVPMPSIKALSPEDVNYLRMKGAFTLHPPHIREAMIRCYFHYVHPFAPILDASEFITEYEKGRKSLLLLWSMFIAAASFVDESLLTEDFFPSRKALKRAMYQRAKAMYDADYEKDKVTLIQSVFLMGHWYTSTDDRAGPWHWNGIAISLSHTIGLHRLHMPANQQASQGTKPFWRRLWWSLYSREVWLSLGLGRPMRIALDDFDTSMPVASDADVLAPEVKGQLGQKYLPEEMKFLFDTWLAFIGLSVTLSNVLATNYRAKGVKPSRMEIEQSENQIRGFQYRVPEAGSHSRVVASHIYQFKLYFETSIIVLYRPFILDTPREIPAADQGSWRTFACQKTRTAASNASAAMNSMMAEDLIRLCHTITVIALVPPMQIHLFESTSSKQMARQMGRHNLALCMVAMDEMRKSYISADASYKLFETAINKVDNAPPHEQHQPSPAAAALTPDTTAFASWPDGYGLGTAGIISDMWSPLPNAYADNASISGTHTDSWLDIQTMDRLWTLDDFSLP